MPNTAVLYCTLEFEVNALVNARLFKNWSCYMMWDIISEKGQWPYVLKKKAVYAESYTIKMIDSAFSLNLTVDLCSVSTGIGKHCYGNDNVVYKKKKTEFGRHNRNSPVVSLQESWRNP